MTNRQWRWLAVCGGAVIATGVSNTLAAASQYLPGELYRDVVTLRWLTMGIALAACAYCAIEGGRALAQGLREGRKQEQERETENGPELREVW